MPLVVGMECLEELIMYPLEGRHVHHAGFFVVEGVLEAPGQERNLSCGVLVLRSVDDVAAGASEHDRDVP